MLLLGVGNVLRADDGAGVHAVTWLRESGRLPAGVEAVDGGTAGLDLLPLLRERRRVVIVDCVAGDAPPGTVVRMAPGEVAAGGHRGASLHQQGILDVLRALEALGHEPECVIVGIVPAELRWSTELSPAVTAGMDRLLQAVLEALCGPLPARGLPASLG